MSEDMAEVSMQRYARAAGVLLLLSFFAGGFGELIVPSKIIIPHDAAATAANLRAFPAMFGFGFATYLVEACCDVALALVFYVLLRPVNKYLALLSAFYGLVSTAVYAFAEFFYFAASLILAADGLPPDQRNSLALLSLRAFSNGSGIFFVFYGIASVIRGWLMFRSRYIPKFLGLLLALAGACFIVLNLLLVLAPRYASDFLLAPMVLSIAVIPLWFLVRGVDVAKLPAAA